ncbi:MAG: penicillin-binding protein [Solobacterium sp.]|nr:penicillin-binding protein [Solobacterium sp.]
MLKRIKRLILFFFLVLVIATAGILTAGWLRYRKVIEEKPLKQAVEEARASQAYAPYETIDRDFVNAVVAVEDKRFFTRSGFDYVALIRAMLNNFKYGKALEGGSTIPQQTAKNLYFVGHGRSRGIPEKVAEVYLMYDMEEHYTKQDILAVYASLNYYGDGFWGLKNASLGYYDTPCSSLTAAEAAVLAGIINAPSAYQLSTGFDLAVSRERRVLSNMLREGYLSESEYEQALSEDVHPRKREKE